jgi:hypothetical protein
MLCRVPEGFCAPLLLLKVSLASILFISAPFSAAPTVVPLSAVSHFPIAHLEFKNAAFAGGR